MLGMNFVFVFEMSVSLMARSNIIAFAQDLFSTWVQNQELWILRIWELWEIIHKSVSCSSSKPYLATEVV